MSIPRHLLITTATVSTSSFGKVLNSCISARNSHFLCQEVLCHCCSVCKCSPILLCNRKLYLQILASFLLWEKHLGNDSSWSEYLSTLPCSFSIPHTLDQCHLNSFPWFLQEQVSGMLELVRNCYSHIVSLIKEVRCWHCQTPATDIFKWEEFLWGWCCVNTRAVFIEPENMPSHSVTIKDRNCLALAPYLDMFNHCDTAKVKVGFNISNGCYEIVTLQPFKKFKEVFINYGPHSNSKLFLEYGFILPSTIHDVVPLKFNHLVDAVNLVGEKIEYQYEKTKFCQKHGLIMQLYASKNGLSWNCLTLLKILLSNSGLSKNWEQISFFGNKSFSGDTDFERVKRTTLECVEKEIISCQNLIFSRCSGVCCVAMSNCSVTLHLLQSLLEKCMSIIRISKGKVRRVSFLDSKS